jgi:hypothetical protein
MLTACFVIIKVIFVEVLNNQVAYDTEFSDTPKEEKAYFFSYGMTLMALLTDFMAKIKQLKIVAKGDIRAAIFKGKNQLFDLLIPENIELIGENSLEINKEQRYSKYRFAKENDNEWMELYHDFEDFKTQLFEEVTAA